MTQETSTHNHSTLKMDQIFTSCLNGEQNAGELLVAYGPYDMVSRTGDRAIVFGTAENEQKPAAPYAIAAIAALALEAACGKSSAQGALRSFAGRGSVGVALQSVAMSSANNNLENGGGQLSALSVAANITDAHARPRLSRAAFNLSAIGDRDLTREVTLVYHSMGHLFSACQNVIAKRCKFPSRSNSINNLDAYLLSAYDELLGSAIAPDDVLQPWTEGMVRAGQALHANGIDLQKLVGPDTLGRYHGALDATRGKIAEGATSLFVSLQLPERQGELPPRDYNGMTPGAAKATETAEAMPSAPTDTASKERATGVTMDRDEWMKRFNETIWQYDECKHTGKETYANLEELFLAVPGLARERLRAVIEDESYFRELATKPTTIANDLVSADRGTTMNQQQTAAAVAAAEARRMDTNRYPQANSRAADYLLERLGLLHTHSVLDLPDGYLAQFEVDRAAVAKYELSVPRLTRAPYHLVQLATQVIANNQHSVLPLGRRPRQPMQTVDEWRADKPHKRRRPEDTGYRQTGKERDIIEQNDAFNAWQKRAEQIRAVAINTHTYLSERYDCDIHLDPERITDDIGSPSGSHAAFRLLGICAQIENDAPMPTDTDYIRQLLNRVDPNSIGKARDAYERLRAHCAADPQATAGDNSTAHYASPLGPVLDGLKKRLPRRA